MLKRLGKVALATVAVGLLAAPQAHAASDIPNTDDNVSRIVTAGSDTTYFVLNDLAKAYMETEGCALNAVQLPLQAASPTQNRCQGATSPESNASAAQANVVKTENYDHDVIVNYFPQGSGAGMRQICAQSTTRDPRVPLIDIARSSSAPGVGFQCTVNNGAPTTAGNVTLRFIAFAKDALTWVGWNGGGRGGVTNLTQAQLNGIYVTCAITNWSQVGGNNTPIIVWTAIDLAGTRSTWDSFVGGNSESCIPAAFKDGNTANGEREIREHRAQPVEEAVNDPAAANEGDSILPFSVGIHSTSADARQNSILMSVNGIAPSETTIADGSFPFSRFLYNVIRQTGDSPRASEATRRFTNSTAGLDDQTQGWLCKPESAHSEPIGTPGDGLETAAASTDYGRVVPNILRDHGLIPLADLTGRRCNFSDYRVDQATMTPL